MPPSISIQGRCAACGYESARVRGDQFIVLVPDPDGVTLAPHPPVFHPFQDYVLEEFGLNFTQAAWRGRLVANQPCLCRGCGHLFERHQLTGGGATIGCVGCLGVLAGASGIGLVIAVISRSYFLGIFIATGLAVLTTFVLECGASFWIRLCYADRARAVAGPQVCPECGSREIRTVDRSTRPATCPLCRGETLTMHFHEGRR